MIDVRRAIEYLTEDELGPKKLLIGAVLTTIPLANVVAVGYEVEVTRRVARGEPRPLPEWNDLGGLFVTGAWLALANIVYSLPILIMVFGGMMAWFVLLFGTVWSEREPSAGFVVGLFIVALAAVGILMVYGFIFGFLSPAILAEYARRGTFAAFFDFRSILRFIQRDPGQYVLAWLAELGLGLVVALISFVASLALAAIPCLGSLAMMFTFGVAAFVMLLFHSHLAGQLMRAGADPVLAKES